MRNFYLSTVFLFLSVFSHAQGTTGYSGTGANIDVDNYRIWWRINPDSAVGIKGVVVMKFKTTSDHVTAITFDLNKVHTIDNLVWNGGSVTPSRSGNIVTVPVNIPVKGTRDSFTITYHGAPPLNSGAATGFTLANDPGAGNYICTLSESYEDRDWWPCKADMQDKADTVDITVNVPWKRTSTTDTFWVASNGTLIDSTINTTDKSRSFTYLNRYPIATYLVCASVARYNRYYRGTVPIGGFNVPVVYYLFAGKSASAYTTILAAMDKATQLLTPFGLKYGNYGFVDPARGGKHGFYEGLTGAGGMEHQTFSAIATGSISNTDVLIHELQHQWFGDKVSFSTWNDLWLAEAFAEYAPGLARELITGLSSTPYAYRSGKRNSAMAEAAPVYIPNSGIGNSNLIWNTNNGVTGYGASVYNRGAMLVSMMRTLAGDTKFFGMMKQYQTRPALQYRSASIDTITKLFTDSLGVNMAPFFTDNVVGTGYPNNTIGYQYYGTGNKSLALSVVSQTRTNSSASYITQPIVIHIKGAAPANDTTIVFYDWGGGILSTAGNGIGPLTPGNVLTYTLSFAPTSVKYDDSLRTTSTGSMVLQAIIPVPVPVKIQNFNAQQHPGYNTATLQLNTTANSTLERAADGINFITLGTMVLVPSTNSQQVNYALNDNAPLAQNNSYRAKISNGDGTYTYSKIVKINSQAVHFSVAGNPSQSTLRVNTQSAEGKNIIFNIYDLGGQPVLNQTVKNAGTVTNIALSSLSRGMYTLKITTEDGVAQTITFIVQ